MLKGRQLPKYEGMNRFDGTHKTALRTQHVVPNPKPQSRKKTKEINPQNIANAHTYIHSL
jgi:hypothetical protein